MYTAHPVANLFPLMSEEELGSLAEDIRMNGLVDPIVMHEKVVLDGRNRLRACAISGVAPKFTAWDGDGDPTVWIISKNLGRRNLSTSQRTMIAARLEPFFAKATKEMSTGRSEAPRKLGRNSTTKAAEEAAAAMGVSGRGVHNAKLVLAGSRALVAAVDAGEIAVDTAVVLTKLPQDEQGMLAQDPMAAKRRAGEIRRWGTQSGAPVFRPAPGPEPRKIMSRRRLLGLRMPANPLASLAELVFDVIDTWERETESEMIQRKWALASVAQRESFVERLDALITATRQLKQGLNNDAPKDEP